MERQLQGGRSLESRGVGQAPRGCFECLIPPRGRVRGMCIRNYSTPDDRKKPGVSHSRANIGSEGGLIPAISGEIKWCGFD